MLTYSLRLGYVDCYFENPIRGIGCVIPFSSFLLSVFLAAKKLCPGYVPELFFAICGLFCFPTIFNLLKGVVY